MPVNTWAYIRAKCPECGRTHRVHVTFPAYNKPFKTTTCTCKCGTTFKVVDPHKYDKDGNIIK